MITVNSLPHIKDGKTTPFEEPFNFEIPDYLYLDKLKHQEQTNQEDRSNEVLDQRLDRIEEMIDTGVLGPCKYDDDLHEQVLKGIYTILTDIQKRLDHLEEIVVTDSEPDPIL